MIDNPDYSKSTIKLLVFQALKHWDSLQLFDLLFDKDFIVRSAAARELQIRGEANIFDKLIKVYNDDRPYVREICAFTLGQFGIPSKPFKDKTIPYLDKLLRDIEPEVRSAAASALGHLCTGSMPENIETQLIAMSADTSDEVRASIACALGSSSGSVTVIAALEKLRTDESSNVRCWAETGLELLKK